MENEKFNIENTESIDAIEYERETGKVILHLTDGMDWSDSDNHMLLLQAKLNNYLRYIDTEQYIEYINKLGDSLDVNAIEIRIEFFFKEPDICNQFIARVEQVVNDNFENVDVFVVHGTN